MKKIINDKEAGVVPKHIAIIVVAIIIIAGIVFVFSGGMSTSYWETEASFGMWQTEIVIEFADGSEKSLKIMQESNEAIFSVMYGGKAISKVRWLISGIATGEGFNKAVVQTSGIKTYWYIKSGTTIKEDGFFNYQFSLTDLWLGSKTSLNQGDINVITKMENNPDLYPAGTYTISFVPQGTVVYWGMPQDEPYDKKTASLPPPRAIGLVVERTPTGSILVTVNSEIITT